MDKRNVYLDNNATTQMAPEVVEIMRQNEGLYANASSMHTLGRISATAIDWARTQLASLIDCDKSEIYFNSGATESNNTVFNIMRDLIDDGSKRDRIIISAVEHPASIETAKYLKKRGYKVDFCPVDRIGFIDLEKLEEMMGDDVLLVSCMTGNNESGVIMPVKEVSLIARKYGAYMHTDATQAIGKIPVSVKDLDVDYLSMSGHKFYGPKGIGVLYIRNKAPKSPLLHGGHQEGGFRPGTYSTQSILGIGKAAELARLGIDEERRQLWHLREMLREGIEKNIPNVQINGSREYEHQLPGTLDVSFLYSEGESILLYLDLEGIEVSTGSACASGSLEPSYVMMATGMDVELAHGSIRFSFGRYNTEEDVEYVLEKLPGIIERIRKMSTRR